MKEYLNKNKDIDEKIAIRFLRDTIEAFKILRKSGYIHRDVKPANILLNNQNNKIIGKLCDFGFATICDDRLNGNTKLKEIVGTPMYMSP